VLRQFQKCAVILGTPNPFLELPEHFLVCRAKERARAYTHSKRRAHGSTFDHAKALCEKKEGACVWSDALLLLILGPLRKNKHLQSTGARTQTTLRPVSRGAVKGGGRSEVGTTILAQTL